MTDVAPVDATPPASATENAPSQPAATPPAVEPAPAVAPPDEAPAAEKPADTKPQGAPEKYEFKYPEGYQVDESALTEYSAAFKELGLTNEQAQRLVDMDAKRSVSSTEANVAAHKQQVESWVGELKNDPDFGGSKFDANLAIANKAYGDFGSPELTQFLKQTGLGTHPLLVKAFHNIGKQMGEGSIHKTTSDQPAERSIAQRMYPDYPA